MPFTLKVSKGAGAGAEFPFESAEATLGRTADNDIVVKDSGASRSHARVYQKGLRYFVEDLKSANGTKVNNAVVTGSREIKTGDTITIGEVVFTFTSLDMTLIKGPGPPEDTPVADVTMLKALSETGDVTGERTGDFPVGKTDDFPANPTGDFTAENPAIDRQETILRPPRTDAERNKPTGNSRPVVRAPPSVHDDETVPPSRALAKAVEQELKQLNEPDLSGTLEVAVPPALVRRGGIRDGDDDEKDELTAADKLRMKRQAGKTVGGRLVYEFKQLPKGARIGAAAFAALLVLGAVGFGVASVLPGKKKSVGPEPVELVPAAPTIEASFGLGDGVTFERADMKVFSFTAASATRIVGVVHYQARDMSKDEVSISLNGYDLGFVPPDTLDTTNRELELVLPATQVRKGDTNQLIFDSTKNPPGDDPWRIWNLWLELIAIPDTTTEETVAAVKEDMQRAEIFYDQRDIGPDSLFKAWKSYRDAWLRMESMTTRPDELYIVARSQQREINAMLDKRCNMMLLDYQKAMNAKKPDKKRAREVGQEMLRYFPSREHRCHGLARELVEDLGGF